MRFAAAIITISFTLVSSATAALTAGFNATADYQVVLDTPTGALGRTLAFDPVSNQLLVGNIGEPNIYCFNAATGGTGSPVTLNNGAFVPVDPNRNLPYFGVGATASGEIYSFQNDTDENGTPGDQVIRWANVNAVPAAAGSPLATLESSIHFPRNISLYQAVNTDYYVEVGAFDAIVASQAINIWAYDGVTFSLADQITDGLASPGGAPEGKSGAALDGFPPRYALGAETVGTNGAHLWENTAYPAFPGTWQFVGTLENTFTAKCADVAFDTDLQSPDERPLMFAFHCDGARAVVNMYLLGQTSIFASFEADLSSVVLLDNAGGGLELDTENNIAYFGNRPSTAPSDFFVCRVGYTPPVTTDVREFATYR
ncbi:MAG: hypothetical protein HUU25_08480 [Candidatus Sumerlaeia bacterium]|nr:hypothetical protein [Candidatus Sumerlaeia bacterium]